MILRTYLIIVIAFCTMSPLFAGKIEKGFKALALFDYFNAKVQFDNSLKSNEGIASFGLSILYSRQKNQFYNQDSAKFYIDRSIKSFNSTGAKVKLKYVEFNWTSRGLDSVVNIISDLFYDEIVNSSDLNHLDRFLHEHNTHNRYPDIKEKRDSIAFFEAVAINSTSSYLYFLKNYPETNYAELAVENFYSAEFSEYTNENSLQNYIDFINDFPESPMVSNAEDHIYEILTKDYSLDNYLKFLERFPNNRNANTAWENFYQLYVSDYNIDKIQEFVSAYSNATNLESVKSELDLYSAYFFPVKVENKYGIINYQGELIAPFEFQLVNAFVDGISIVVRNGKYGVINKLTQTLIECKYDEINYLGKGLFSVMLDDLYGVVDRNDHLIVPFIYDEIGELSSGMIYVSLNGLYGYVNAKGEAVVDFIYTNAFDFEGLTAIVESQSGYGVIEVSGNEVIDPVFSEVVKIGLSRFKVRTDNGFGCLSASGDTIITPVLNGLASYKHGVVVGDKNDSLFFFDLDGNILIDGYKSFANYESISEYTGNSVVVQKKKYLGRLSKDGDWISSFKYSFIDNNTLGFIGESKGGLELVVNPNTKVEIDHYDELKWLSDELILCKKGAFYGVINLNGQIVLPINYDEITLLENDLLIVRLERGYGLVNNGALLTELNFDKIESFDKAMIRLEKNGEYLYIDKTNFNLIRLKQ